jgi:hypothetical protein
MTFRVILDPDDTCKRSCLPDVDRSLDVFHLPANKITGHGPVRSCSGREPVSRQKMDVVQFSCTSLSLRNFGIRLGFLK